MPPARATAVLPAALSPKGALSREYVAAGAPTLAAAAELIEALPYGRNTQADPRLVLREQRGTCSTKHAAFTLLCQEADVSCRLVVGLFVMTERNTPGVGAVLAAAGLPGVLEAHCFVELENGVLDLTGGAPGAEPPRFEELVEIDPLQLPRKALLHRNRLAKWAIEAAPAHSPDAVWDVRERCIAALSRAAGTPAPQLLRKKP